MAEPSILVVGANGFLGSRAVAALLAAGRLVHVFGPPVPGADLLAPWRERISQHAGSITEVRQVAAALAAARAEIVLSFAAHGEGREGLIRSGEIAAGRAFAVNVGGFRTLLAACAEAGVRRVVWASSTVVFGPAEEYASERVDETAPAAPRTIYGLTKVLAEEVGFFYRRRTDMEICAVRPPLVFGPGRWYGGAAQVLDRLLASAARREAIALTVPAEQVDLIHGDDVASAFLHLARYPGPLAPCYHVTGFTTSYREIAALLCQECAGFRPSLDDVRSSIVYPLISAARIERETGFRPRLDLAGALHQTLQEIVT